MGQAASALYRPLDPRRKQIRLCRIEASSDEDIYLSLYVAELGGVAYHAVSYTWGEKNDLRQIYVDGHSFMIRPNLYAFLQTVKAEQSLCEKSF